MDLLNSIFSTEEVEELEVEAYDDGYGDGYDDGYDDGADDTWNKNKVAISDGLRKGSSECGREMAKQRWKK